MGAEWLALVSVSAVAAEGSMADIPGGEYLPLYGERDQPVPVAPFRLDRTAVTNEAFRGFLEREPGWREDVPTLFADEGYLAHFDQAPAQAPVVEVSWFAARAYCTARGARLPTMDEWEFAARADESRADATADEAFHRRILDWYASPSRRPLPQVRSTWENVWGVWDLHSLVWEWVEDFNAVIMTGESRKDGTIDRQLVCAAGSVGSVDPADYAAFLRYAMRGSLEARYTTSSLGFRCAEDPP